MKLKRYTNTDAESHEPQSVFQGSTRISAIPVFRQQESSNEIELCPAYLSMSDNANLLDVMRSCKVGRFIHYIVAKSAVMR
jgi:hypothetical protein